MNEVLLEACKQIRDNVKANPEIKVPMWLAMSLSRIILIVAEIEREKDGIVMEVTK